MQSAIDALGHEIDQRTLVEKSLRAANDTLEARVRERTVQLEELNRTLLQDNARFAAAADAAGMGFWTFDVASNELQWDERMFRLYGRSSDCTPASEIRANSLHPDDRDKCAEEARKALLGFSAYDVEYRIVRPNGAVRNVRSVARITRDARGGATQMIGVSFDITDLKRADDRFRLAIEAAPTGMLLMSGTGSIVLVNAEIETLFGYPRAELLGRQIEMLVPERFRTHHPEFRAKFFSAPVARPMGAGRDLYGLRKDGSEVPIEIGLTPLHTFEGDFVLSSIVDLSMRREMEQMRTDFVSTVSHELRTPLTSINGSLGLLQAGAMGALCEEAAAMVEIAYKNSGRLVRIINDILDIGKLEAGELAMQRISVPLSDLLRQSVEVNSSYAEKYSVHFVLDEQCAEGHVLADPDRLMQVVTNLLSNAAKFSPPGESVRIRVLRKPGTMRVEVEDSGAGIPEAFKNRIFEKFAQADSSASRNFEGTGLGLSIARKLIEAMDGS